MCHFLSRGDHGGGSIQEIKKHFLQGHEILKCDNVMKLGHRIVDLSTKEQGWPL